MRYLEYNTPELQFKIELSGDTTVVYGDGNIGKTCIFNKLYDAVMQGKLPNNIYFVNMRLLPNVPLIKEVHSPETLIIIDDFDAVRVVYPEIVTWINMSINRVLIFGRNLHNLRVDKHYLYRAKQNGTQLEFTPMLARRLY